MYSIIIFKYDFTMMRLLYTRRNIGALPTSSADSSIQGASTSSLIGSKIRRQVLSQFMTNATRTQAFSRHSLSLRYDWLLSLSIHLCCDWPMNT